MAAEIEALNASKLLKSGTAPVSALKSRGRRTSDDNPMRCAESSAELPTRVRASWVRLAMLTAPDNANAEPSALLPLASTLLIAWLPICATVTWLSTTIAPALSTLVLAPMLAVAVWSPSTTLIAPPRRKGDAVVGVVAGGVLPPSWLPVSLAMAPPMPAPASDCATLIRPSLPLLIASTCSWPGSGSLFGPVISVLVLLRRVMLAACTVTSPAVVRVSRSRRASAAISCRLIAPARPTAPFLSARAVAEVSSETALTAETLTLPACSSGPPASITARVSTLTLLIAAVNAAVVLFTANDSAASFSVVSASAFTATSPPATRVAPERTMASVVALICAYAAPRLSMCFFGMGLPLASFTGSPLASVTTSPFSYALPAAELSMAWRVLACSVMSSRAVSAALSFTSTRAVVVPCRNEICSPSSLSAPRFTSTSPRSLRMLESVTLLTRSALSSSNTAPSLS
ncbi:hypothetical protein D3C71_1257350 [compost metagenome]